MIAFRTSPAVLLLGTCLLGGCTAMHGGQSGNALKLQTSTGHSTHAKSLPADVWPGTAMASQNSATDRMPPAAEGEPLQPTYEEGAASSSGQYQIKGSGAVKRVSGASNTSKSHDSSHPTYSIEPTH